MYAGIHGFSRIPENDNTIGRTNLYCLLILMHPFISAKKSILTQTVCLVPLTQPIGQEGRLNHPSVFQLILVILDTRKRYYNKPEQSLPVDTQALIQRCQVVHTDSDGLFSTPNLPSLFVCVIRWCRVKLGNNFTRLKALETV